MDKSIGKKFTKKRLARRVVFSALYASLITGGAVDIQATQDAMEGDKRADVDLNYVSDLIQAYKAHKEKIDDMIQKCTKLSKRAGNTDVELAILQMATAELLGIDLPQKVVINEAIEIAKEYGADDGYKYINAVLDKITKQVSGLND